MGRYDVLWKMKQKEKHQAGAPPAVAPLPEKTPQQERSHLPELPENQQSSFPEIPKSSDPEIVISGKDENLKSRLTIRKFSTQLRDESIRAIKRLAIEESKKDYEIVQEAIDKFLEKK